MLTGHIALRPAREEDEEFANHLLHLTMQQYVEATWPNDKAAHRDYYGINKFKASGTRIIQIEGKDVGRLSTTRLPDCVFIDELHILPEYQRHGIGQYAIEQVLMEAQERRLPVRLTVLKVNPAQNLYLRMGFTMVAERDHRLHMQYSTIINRAVSPTTVRDLH